MSYKTVLAHVDKQMATLVAVSKTKPNKDIIELYNLGQRDFGENRVQELVQKENELPKDIRWHQIGSLQSNKVKYIVPFVHLIHSVDSKKLLNTIIKEANKIGRCVEILLQVKVAKEESKQGLNAIECRAIIDELVKDEPKEINVRGLMAMASYTYDQEIVKSEFLEMKSLYDEILAEKHSWLKDFNTLSMGMSGDYLLAMECGSNMVRVGSLIFGSR